ncbi:unnamed protein product [Ambrosiozyma monospora]|uniref:Unnamed protein product n=1 Tax=Ambrosiozyma monospora TaxID=43982 RepID=A0A9W6YRF1_AMBMO|nr:unnamed protein product [Ambrosiozyma monospora]
MEDKKTIMVNGSEMNQLNKTIEKLATNITSKQKELDSLKEHYNLRISQLNKYILQLENALEIHETTNKKEKGPVETASHSDTILKKTSSGSITSITSSATCLSLSSGSSSSSSSLSIANPQRLTQRRLINPEALLDYELKCPNCDHQIYKLQDELNLSQQSTLTLTNASETSNGSELLVVPKGLLKLEPIGSVTSMIPGKPSTTQSPNFPPPSNPVFKQTAHPLTPGPWRKSKSSPNPTQILSSSTSRSSLASRLGSIKIGKAGVAGTESQHQHSHNRSPSQPHSHSHTRSHNSSSNYPPPRATQILQGSVIVKNKTTFSYGQSTAKVQFQEPVVQRQAQGQAQTQTQSHGKRSKKKICCSFCDKEGHKRSECPSKLYPGLSSDSKS